MGKKLQILALEEEQEKRILRPERFFYEINLLHLEGHYFTFDPKTANVFLDPMKSVEERLENPKINAEKPIEVTPHPGFGRPSVFAYKVYQASSRSFLTMATRCPKLSPLGIEKSCDS